VARADPGPALKARLQVLVGTDQRLVGFDNERGKGDHMHIAGAERPYSFTSLDQLLTDFFAEVRKAGGEP
jgi:hypothetical protein